MFIPFPYHYSKYLHLRAVKLQMQFIQTNCTSLLTFCIFSTNDDSGMHKPYMEKSTFYTRQGHAFNKKLLENKEHYNNRH